MLRHIRYMVELAAKMLTGLLIVAFAVMVHFDLVHRQETRQAVDYLKVAKEKVVAHVVKIDVTMMGMKYTSGTGFHLEFYGKVYLVTNNHVCEPSLQGFQIDTIDQKNMEIIKISKTHDLCLIKSNREVGLKLAHSPVELMDRVILVGHPRGLPLTIREGHVMEIGYDVFPWMGTNPISFAQISTTTYGGSSGSPVVNDQGQVVGVLFAGYRNEHTEGFMVPWGDLLLFLDRTTGE